MEMLHKSKYGHVERWDSLEEFLSHFSGANVRDRYRSNYYFQGPSGHKAIEAARCGDARLADAAEQQLADLNVSGILAGTDESWQTDVCGAVPIVPNLLAGFPDNMLAMRSLDRRGARGPVKIVVGLDASDGLPQEQVIARALSCVGLAIRLASYRPVDLSIYTDNRFAVSDVRKRSNRILCCIPLSMSPLDLPVILHALTSPAFRETLAFARTSALAERPGVGWHYGMPPHCCLPWLREDLQLADGDILIEGAHTADPDIYNPAKFILRHLEPYMQGY